MTIKDFKKQLKKYGLYDAIADLKNYDGVEYERGLEVIYRVLDNIDGDTLNKAIKRL